MESDCNNSTNSNNKTSNNGSSNNIASITSTNNCNNSLKKFITTSVRPKGHYRSASLENSSGLFPVTKTSLLPPNAIAGFTGTLKSRREQKRISDYISRTQSQDLNTRKQHFENIREIFERSHERLNQTNEELKPEKCSKNRLEQIIPTRDTDVDPQPLIEADENVPPKIQSCSGVLGQGKHVIRPVAFKPVPCSNSNSNNNNNKVSSNSVAGRLNNELIERYGSTPSLLPIIGGHQKFGSTNDLNQGAFNYGSLSLYKRNGSTTSSTSIPFKTYDSLESIMKLPGSVTPTQSMSKSMGYFNGSNHELIAPSPSDSGVSELEAALRDRDSELAYLRHTMEHNEQVIFKVHQDKERLWEKELKRMKVIHESRLKAGAEKVHKLEQLLMMQTFQLRQDKKRLVEDTNRLHQQINKLKEQIEKQRNELSTLKATEKEMKEQNNDLTEEIQMLRRIISELKEKLEESEWSLCQRNGEISLMKTQLKDTQNELASRDKELIQLKSSIQAWSDKNYDKSKMRQDMDLDLEITQLNRVIIFKDQVLVAMNNEIQKLQKELADASMLNEYDGVPTTGRYSRHKSNSLGSTGTNNSPCTTSSPTSSENRPIEDTCSDSHNNDHNDPYRPILINNYTKSATNHAESKRIFLNSQINFNHINIENVKNIPLNLDSMIIDGINNYADTVRTYSSIDDNIYVNSSEDDFKSLSPSQELLSQDSENYVVKGCVEKKHSVDEVARLHFELERNKKLFEEEKLKWAQEKEKVLIYQRQLQKNYLEVLKKTEELEKKLKNTTES